MGYWHKGDTLIDIGELLLNGFTTQVQLWPDGPEPVAWRIWKLIPVNAEDVFTSSQRPPEALGSGSLPSYDGDATGQSSTHTRHSDSEHGEFGTVVTEVTTTVVTTRKRYRVEDP